MIQKMCLLLVTLIFSVARAGTIDPSVSDAKYLSYGQKYTCVAPINGECGCGKEKEKHRFHASCVIFKPRWALTAAHVVNNNSDVQIIVGGKTFRVKKVIVKKEFKDEVLGSNDIALCQSEEDFELDFYPELYKDTDEVGKVSGICGYGITGTFSTGATRSDGKKRAGSNIVERVDSQCLICVNRGGRRTELEFMISSGDSGGGLFIDGKLAGINSFVMATDGSPNSNYGDECAHTRISAYVQWIEEQMAQNE